MTVLEMKLFLGMKSVGCILRCLWDVVGDVFGDDKKRLAMTVGDEKKRFGDDGWGCKKVVGAKHTQEHQHHPQCMLTG